MDGVPRITALGTYLIGKYSVGWIACLVSLLAVALVTYLIGKYSVVWMACLVSLLRCAALGIYLDADV